MITKKYAVEARCIYKRKRLWRKPYIEYGRWVCWGRYKSMRRMFQGLGDLRKPFKPDKWELRPIHFNDN